jgi:hypothetical protein
MRPSFVFNRGIWVSNFTEVKCFTIFHWRAFVIALDFALHSLASCSLPHAHSPFCSLPHFLLLTVYCLLPTVSCLPRPAIALSTSKGRRRPYAVFCYELSCFLAISYEPFDLAPFDLAQGLRQDFQLSSYEIPWYAPIPNTL